MKSIFHGISFLALVGMTAVGCQKEQLSKLNNVSVKKNEKEVKVKDQNNKKLTSYRIFGWFNTGIPEDPGPYPYCDDSGGNCLPDHVVYGEVFNDLNDAIANDTLADFFQQNLVTDVFDFVNSSYIEDYQQGLEEGDLVFLLEIDNVGIHHYILIDAEDASLDKEELTGELVHIVIPIQYEL